MTGLFDKYLLQTCFISFVHIVNGIIYDLYHIVNLIYIVNFKQVYCIQSRHYK